MAVFFGKLQNGMGLVIESIPGSNSVLFQTAYHVGSAHESPKQAGIAHLFEHVMFGGSTHVASYDDALHRVGGTSNAYTTKDATHYWCKLPAYQLEIACWLESDRMAYLRCDQEVVETQRNVVIEEYKQTTLDEPYGGVWPAITAIS